MSRLTLSVCSLLVVVAFAASSFNDPTDPGVHWALIVAGSSGWYNYRHQADACHAYQILKKHGIPDERIVVMMYDDIANNTENPTPGVIINYPNGSDVYAGVPKDYTKEDVTPENFLNILQGNKDAMAGIGSGKVIASGPDDHVFVFFTDHGAPGLIAFPESELHARPLMDAITSMYNGKKYAQMVLYIEACESGSMFDGLLPDNINVWATTAANPNESSYACYFDPKRETYLGDVYSVKWMEDSDKEDLKAETLKKQFKIVKRETNTSHVMEYGDDKIATEHVGDFQGAKDAEPVFYPDVPLGAVPQEQVPLAILQHRLMATTDDKEVEAIVSEMKSLMDNHKDIADTMQKIVDSASYHVMQAQRVSTTRLPLRNFDCYELMVDHFDRHCFDLSRNEYALRQLYKLVNLCEEGVPMNVIAKSIYNVCRHKN